MLDLTKLKYLKIVGYILAIVVAAVVGFGIGQSLNNHSSSKGETRKTVQTTKQAISPDQVKQFLLNYYTKKDLGENRKRYKEYMTDALYQQTVSTEDEPQNQTYKGFVVDFKFKTAEIYINQESLQEMS